MSALEDLTSPDQGLLDAALEISRRRKDTQRRLKTAIRARDWETADQLITELVPDDKKGNRTPASLNGRTGRRR